MFEIDELQNFQNYCFLITIEAKIKAEGPFENYVRTLFKNFYQLSLSCKTR